MPEPEVDETAPVRSDAAPPAGLLEAFWRFERALAADDVDALRALSVEAVPVPGGGGMPERRIAAVQIRVLDSGTAVVVADLAPPTGGRGRQTQVWRNGPSGWRVLVAQSTLPPPAVDARMWRQVGTPLVPGADTGPLVGRRLAVKDLFAVAGHRIGAGVPAYLEHAAVQQHTAPAVRLLLDAGAQATGIARTDELAYSITGANPHYGTPPNGRVPGGLPGGSSSGPASAVALGQADIGLGTDTAGSIRVPASYQGLWGLRTTHGRISRKGLLPLAPSFDAVGWLARDRAVLAACSRVSAVGAPAVPLPERFVTASALLAALAPEVQERFGAWTGRLPGIGEVDLGDVAAAQEAFRVVQAFEAWQSHGAWLTAHPGAVVGAVAERFRAAAEVLEEDAELARIELAEHRQRFARALQGAVLVLPSAASVAPRPTADPRLADAVRAQTLRLTCVAGVLGAPALSAPLLEVDGAPLGICLVGPRHSDDALLHRAASLPA